MAIVVRTEHPRAFLRQLRQQIPDWSTTADGEPKLVRCARPEGPMVSFEITIFHHSDLFTVELGFDGELQPQAYISSVLALLRHVLACGDVVELVQVTGMPLMCDGYLPPPSGSDDVGVC
jgi:hypothetical protein